MALKLGIERIGLIALKRPIISAIVVLLITAAGVAGTLRMSVDDSLSELFRSDTPEFQQYERLDKRFPSSEYDVLVVVEGKELLKREGIEAFRNMVIEFQFVPATKGVISMFSAREPPVNGQIPQQLFPSDLPEGAEFDALIAKARDNRIIRDRLLSADGELALVVIALDKDQVATEGMQTVVDQIAQTARDQLQNTGLRISMSGVPVMQLEIRNAVQRDRLIYNGVGFGLGALICLIFFRSIAFTLIAVSGPAVALIWGLGTLGYMDMRLNLFLNVITPLVMVISFADSMHMVFGIRRRLLAGDDAVAAARYAVLNIGPASALTSITNMVAFISLIFSSSALIRSFGISGIIATTLVFFAVIITVPLLSVLLLRGKSFATAAYRETDTAMNRLNAFTSRLASHVSANATGYTMIACLLAGIFGYGYSQLTPQYKLADQVPDQEQAMKAAGKLDEKLTGANPIHILVEWKDGSSLYDERRLEAIGKVHDIVEQTAGLGNVWSLHTLKRWLAEGGENRTEVLKGYVEILPDYLTRRFLTAEGDAVVVTGRVPDIDISRILPVVDKLDEVLQPVRAEYPELTVSVSGLSAIAARNGASMIDQLNGGLFADILIAMLLIMVFFRSVQAGLMSLVPNLLPILAAGAMLQWSGIGLQFASIVALTVAFGLAIDNIVHYLYRQSMEDEESGATVASVERTLDHIGPVVLLTTLVLIAGLSMPVFSALPSLRLFAVLSAVVLGVALLSVLIFLPAIIIFTRRLLSRSHTPASQRDAPAE